MARSDHRRRFRRMVRRNVHEVRDGQVTNIVLGIVGAALGNWLLKLIGISLSGWTGYLIAGFVGACIIIALWRLVRGRSV
jgi:uncharacterized membrane protein YeaQ/YmgE (transglycosylase-associated protein family)